MAEFAAMTLLKKTIVTSLVAGTAVSAYGAIQQGLAAEAQGKTEQDILNINAQRKMELAEDIREAAEKKAEIFKKKGKELIGKARVAGAKGRVLATGSIALNLEEMAQALEEDRITILQNEYLRAGYAEEEAYGLRFQGISAKARGKAAKRGALLSATGTLLTGFGGAGYAHKKLKES